MLKINSVSFKYRPGSSYVLKDCRAVFNTFGKFLITGKNGAGKSTFMDIASGFRQPHSGSVSYFGVDMYSSTRNLQRLRCLISYLPASLVLSGNLRVRDYISLWSGTFFPGDIIGDLDLEKHFNCPYSELSDGYKMRLKLAITFSRGVYILVDEPLKSQDGTVFDMFSHLVDTYTRGRTVIVDNPSMIGNLKWDKVYNIEGGRINEV
ncbi:MAG: ATP-binding cassette domain-containing protein [Oligoflexia bacterium]|nr:ATP-binding cassette domain-containing protein [Oligoflexia bacterium]